MTILKPLERDYVIQETIRYAMSGNTGVALVTLRRKIGQPRASKESAYLNKRLIEIELHAREKMRVAIEDYLNSIK